MTGFEIVALLTLTEHRNLTDLERESNKSEGTAAIQRIDQCTKIFDDLLTICIRRLKHL